MDGILLIDKPTGISTFDIVRRFKGITGFKGKLGHGGTLDVFASGLTLLLLGKKTKDFDNLLKLDKEYEAGIRLGYSSKTLDVEGDLISQGKEILLTREMIESVIPKYLGEIEQSIPAFSAAKQSGKSLYKIAREGNIPISKSKNVNIHSINVIGIKKTLVTLAVKCSSGTYIRQLTFDMFNELEIDSFLYSLRRTRVGEYYVKNALSLEDLKEVDWQDKLIS
jgi:tRNA pseudouridine55 synthase